MNKPKIDDDEMAVISELLSEALNGSRTTNGVSIARFVAQVEAADRAGRAWPDVLRDLALWEWTQRRQTALAKRESVVFIDHAGHKVGKATRVGKRVRTADGDVGFQQSLIADMSWDELRQWGDLISAQIYGLDANRSMIQRLEALHGRFPDTEGPQEACSRLGTTVAEFLSADAEAAS